MENQAFQSLLQLAVAMNIGFAAVATFRGSSLGKEKERVDALFRTAQQIRAMMTVGEGSIGRNDADDFRRVTRLRNTVTSLEIYHDRLFDGVGRWIALACAIVSFILLVVASWAGTLAYVWLSWGAVIINLPLLCFISYAAYISIVQVGPLKKERNALDKNMSSKLEALELAEG